jgi:murein endopeptidase
VQVDCKVTATLKPLNSRTTTPAFFGGHHHTPDDQLLGKVENANDPGAGAGTVTTGHTLSGFTIVYTAPEASGAVQLETKWEPPSNYECQNQNQNEDDLGSFTNPCIGFNHFNIGLPGLQDLPPDTAYTVIRDQTTTHPEGTSGTPSSLKRLAVVAVIYGIATNLTRTLSINDMSLPQGGLFDIGADWDVPHAEHRLGTQADINQQGIPCLSDFALQAAIRAVGAGRLCESGGRKHINF